jgi:hypothetical protein
MRNARVHDDEKMVEFVVVGRKPKWCPYLRVGNARDGTLIATVSKERSLRALARRILKAIGDL